MDAVLFLFSLCAHHNVRFEHEKTGISLNTSDSYNGSWEKVIVLSESENVTPMANAIFPNADNRLQTPQN
jgi:hypothetical protein